MEEKRGCRAKGAERDTEDASNDALFHVEDGGREEEELAEVSEARGNMDVVGKNVKGDRKTRFSDGTGPGEPLGEEVVKLHAESAGPDMDTEVGGSRSEGEVGPLRYEGSNGGADLVSDRG